MALDLDFTGGESVYCINQTQIRHAMHLANEDPGTAPRIRREIERLEATLTRNERAALAFVMIDKLLRTPAESQPEPRPAGQPA
jgi:hypothetical protein